MFVLELFLNDSYGFYSFCNKKFFMKFKIQNILIKHCIHLFNKLNQDDLYNSLLEEYKTIKKDSSKTNRKKKLIEELTNIRESYGLTKNKIQKYAKKQQVKYSKYIASQEAQVIANEVWRGCEDVLYKKSKLHFKKLEDINSVSSKSLLNGIRFDETTKTLYINKYNKPLIFKEYDKSYIEECFKNKLKYCKLIRKPFNTGYRYYIQMVFEGASPIKYTKGVGDSGIDPGVSTIAVSTPNKCILKDLAPNIESYNKRIIEIQKKMERSLRLNNPTCYNEDGTIKKGSKFIKTKNYKKLSKLYKSLNRKRTEYIENCHYKLIKEIISDSSTIYCEKMNYKALQKKTKTTKRDIKTSLITTKKGPKEIHKYNRKKRFGKSLKNKSPAKFLERLIKKADFYNIEVKYINTKTFKASQYNHLTDSYIKKELKERWNQLDKDIIQRDLYSAYLIQNSKKDLKQTDRDKCKKNYEKFKKNHDKCIEEIKAQGQERPKSFGF